MQWKLRLCTNHVRFRYFGNTPKAIAVFKAQHEKSYLFPGIEKKGDEVVICNAIRAIRGLDTLLIRVSILR